MHHKLSIFVSHSWSSVGQYESLSMLLDSISDLNWQSVSVLKNNPFLSKTMGEPAQQQELNLQRSRLQRLRDEAEDMQRSLDMYSYACAEWKQQCEAAKNLQQEITAAEASMFPVYMVKLLEKNHGKSLFTLRAIANKSLPEPTLPAELKNATERLNELERLKRLCKQRIAQLRSNSGLGVYLIKYGHRDITHQFPKMPENVIEEDRNLVLMLEAQIAQADVVIVVAEFYAQLPKVDGLRAGACTRFAAADSCCPTNGPRAMPERVNCPC